MKYDLTPFMTAPVLISIVAVHVALLLCWRKFNPLYLIAGGFLVASVLSTGPNFPGYVVAKYARVYATVLIVVVGLIRFRIGSLRPAARALVLFAVLHLLGALWSTVPLWALIAKSLFFWAVLAGVFMAYDIRNQAELLRGIRLLVVVLGIGGLITLVVVLKDPLAALRVGRLSLWGGGANLVGANAAMGLLLCSYLGLHERTKGWKVFAFSTAGLLAAILAWTGSRSALLTAVAGALILVLPATKRRFSMLVLILFVGVVPYLILSRVQSGGIAQRLISTVDTRTQAWSIAFKDYISDRPIIGHGWVSSGSWLPQGVVRYNAHSSYLQMLLDLGLLGLVAFGICALVVATQSYRTYRFVRRHSASQYLAFLPLGLLGAVVVGAVATGATLAATQSTTLFLGFSVGLIDRLPGMVADEKRRELIQLIHWRALRRRLGGWGYASPAPPSG